MAVSIARRWICFLFLFLFMFPPAVLGQQPDSITTGYLVSYFKGNGEDGLHLAYSLDGYTWKALREDRSFLVPTAGQDRLMRDPSVVQGPDGLFHMVWTVSWGEKGIGYARSKDLVHWSEQRFLPVMEHELGARNCWAPELFYDARTREYVIFWASTIPGRFPETDGQDAGGDNPGYNHRIYYTTTKDFRTFGDTRLFYDAGFNVIDAFMVENGGRYHLFIKDETNKPFEPQKTIRITTSHKATGPFGPPSPPVTSNYWAEGPAVLRVGNKWFLYFDKYTEHRYGLLTSEDLVHWKDESDRLVVPEGIRHGTAFRVDRAVLNPMMQP